MKRQGDKGMNISRAASINQPTKAQNSAVLLVR